MVILFLSLFPGRIHLAPGDSIPLFLEKGLRCEVEPPWLGTVKNGVFYAGLKEGAGIIRISGEEEEMVFVRVDKNAPPLILPPVIRLGKGERVRLKLSREEEVLRWRVIPPYLGEVRDGVFFAEEEGEGRIVAITEKGISQAKVEVGRIDFRVRIFPKISRIMVGDEVRFRIEPFGEKVKWWVYPEKRGEILPGGIFKARCPGRCLVQVVVERNGKKGVGEALVHVREERVKIIPSGAFLKVGEAKKFMAVAGGSRVKCRWRVIPEEGVTFKNGVFIPEKKGIYALVAYPEDKELRPGIAVCVVDVPPELRIFPDSVKIGRDEEVRFRVSESERVLWKVIPSQAGTITPDGVFHPGDWEGKAKIIGVSFRGRLPVKWGFSKLTIHQGQSFDF